jgi:hypothetical protein
MSETTAKIEALRHAVYVARSKKSPLKQEAHNAACDNIIISLEAAISRLENGDEMQATAEVQSQSKIEPHWTLVLTKGQEPIVKRSDTLNDHIDMILQARIHFSDASIVSLTLNPGDHNQLWAHSDKTLLAITNS